MTKFKRASGIPPRAGACAQRAGRATLLHRGQGTELLIKSPLGLAGTGVLGKVALLFGHGPAPVAAVLVGGALGAGTTTNQCQGGG